MTGVRGPSVAGLRATFVVLYLVGLATGGLDAPAVAAAVLLLCLLVPDLVRWRRRAGGPQDALSP